MNVRSLLQPLIRWFNRLPLWRRATIRVWGQFLHAPTFDRWLCLGLHRVGLMGKEDHDFLSGQIRPGWTVVDIGANQGLYSLMFSRLVGPSGRVLAFEPDDMLFAALSENLSRNGTRNVRPCRLALGSVAGEMILHRSLLNSGDNRLAAQSRAGGLTEAVKIKVERLDAVLAGEHVDFIKMDVQGWEMEAFQGMENLLADPNHRALVIYFEFWPQGLSDAGSSPLEPLAFLAERGFGLFRMERGTMLAIHDLPAFVRSVKPSAYLNLYASRPHPPL